MCGSHFEMYVSSTLIFFGNSLPHAFAGDNITTENISAFIEEYDEEKLERKELQEEDEGEEDGAGQ
jgi:hypothetical protein